MARMPLTISILGCGYVGLPVAEALISRGWRVRGSTTRTEKLLDLLRVGIEPYLVRLTPKPEGRGLDDFFDSEVVFLNFPPGRRRKDVASFLARAMEGLIGAMRAGQVRRVIFASSTSVYGAGRVTESDATLTPALTDSGRALLKAEKALLQQSDFNTTVLRYGGLYGYHRPPGRFLMGRTIAGGRRAVNLVHRDDAVGVAVAAIEQGRCNEIFNVCADRHPTRQAFYTKAAQWLSCAPPEFADHEDRPDKVVLNDKVRRQLAYEFVHPDPMRRAP